MFQNIQTSPLKIVLTYLAGQLILVACADLNGGRGQSDGSAKSESTTSNDAKQNVTAASPSVERGATIFKREMCAGCHADGGNDLMPSKPIKGASFGRQYADDSKLEKTIRKGFPASGMPEFGAERINQAEMKNLILYIRSFTRKSE